MRKAFQQKGFGRLFAGMTTSMFGDFVNIIFAIMAGFTGAAVVYLLVSLRGKMFRSDSPLPAPPLEPSRLI